VVSCITSGSGDQMLAKEAELRSKGYALVRGPHVGPMEYCRVAYRNGSPSAFNLLWIENGKKSSLNDPDAEAHDGKLADCL
jgi:hypothetical protein